MQCNATILVGPARAGKTSQLLDAYRTAVAAEPPGGALWLGPNHAAVDSVRQSLLGPELKQCLRPNCLTFSKLAQAILDATSSRLRPVNELMKRRLLEGIVRCGVESKDIRHFASIANTPGLVRLVAGVIRQWKRLEVWPEEFAAACQQSGMSQKDRELLWIYEEYQRLLTSHELYDPEGRLWLARTQLRDGNFRPFEAVRHVFVDGFTDFTRTELEMLILFASRAETIHITLPGEGASAQASRDELFAKPSATLAELQRRLPGATVRHLDRRTTSFPAMDSIEANLFRLPGTFAPATSAGVTIVNAAGRRQEMDELARRIKTLLTLDEDPIKPGQILVVLRTLADNAALLDEAFARFGIPVAIEEPPRLGQSACVSSLVAWLKLIVEDWPFRQLLAILSHNSLQPDWPQWQHGRAALAAEQLVRELQIPHGQQELLARLDERVAANAASTQEERGQHQLKQAELAAKLLHKIASVTNALPAVATPREWIVAFTALVNEIGSGKLIRSDKLEEAAWNRLLGYLRSIDRLHQWMGPARQVRAYKAKKTNAPGSGSEVVLDRDELMAVITEIASTEAGPASRDTTGRVRVVSAATARSLSASHVFVVGLTEKSFPSFSADGALYGEAEIAQLAQAGLPLPTQTERSHDEMLLFYEVITRATRELVLSYPGLDDKAQPMPCSPYLSEFLSTFAASGFQVTVKDELSPVPVAGPILSEQDWRLRAVHDACQAGSESRVDLLAGILQTQAQRPESPVADPRPALLMAGSRTQRAFGAFEGLMNGDAVVQALNSRDGEATCWSASQLETYAYCPYKYFLSYVLRIKPLTELALETDHLERGSLLHETLSRVHRRLNQDAGMPVRPASLPEADFNRLMADTLKEAATAQPGADRLTAALREVDRRVIEQWLLGYYGQHQNYDKLCEKAGVAMFPALFEVQFGPERAADSDEPTQLKPDVLYSPEPLEIRFGEETIRIRGRIDRVDLGEVDGQTVFHLIDYKSSREMKFGLPNVQSGERLQLVLYALAVEQLLLADRQARPWRVSYWLVRKQGVNHKACLDCHTLVDGHVEATDVWRVAREQLPAIVAGLVHGIRGGNFPVYSADEKCTSRCDFSTICRIGQIRSLDKVWHIDGLPQAAAQPEVTS